MNVSDLFNKSIPFPVRPVKQDPSAILALFNQPVPVHRLYSSILDCSDKKMNTLKIKRITYDEPKINKSDIPIRIIKINVANEKPVVQAYETKPTNIKIVIKEHDKPKIDKPQEMKVLKIHKSKNVNPIEPPLPQQQQQNEVQNKINQFENQNRLLVQKLIQMTTACAHAFQQNKNLAFALSMMR
jgi:hypothetical protein